MNDIAQKSIFSKNLRKRVSDAQKTQAEIASDIGVSPQTFNTWMRGIAIPRMGKIQALADYFGIAKSDLIEEKSRDASEAHDTLIYADDDFEIYSSSRRLQDNAEPFIRNSLLTLTAPIPVEEPTPTRAEILDWLAEHVRTAAYGGSNYEDFSDEDLLAFYLDIRKEAEDN